MQRNRNGSGDLVAPTNPCHGDRQQRLEGVQGGEAEKNSDSGTERNGVRRVSDGHQCHVMRDEPAFEPRERLWQA